VIFPLSMIAALIHLRNSSVRSLASSKPHLMRRAEGAELKTFNICDNLQPRRDRHVGIGSRSFASRLGVTSYLRRCRRASARSMSYWMRRRTSSLIASSLRNPMTVSRSVSNASRASCSKSREYSRRMLPPCAVVMAAAEITAHAGASYRSGSSARDAWRI
jgi:hypothetical protein